MEPKNISISYAQYADITELSEQDRSLYLKACEVVDSAYAPYSNFYVGAALLLQNGKIVTGNNQENIAYPSGLCAERVAIFATFSQNPDAKILTLAIAAKFQGNWVEVSPCGACRQVMAEYEKLSKQKMRILFTGKNNSIMLFEGVESLLPFIFSK